MKSNRLKGSSVSVADSNLRQHVAHEGLVRAFEYQLVHWLVTEVDPFDISVWCKNGSAKRFITYELLTGRFLIRNSSSDLSSTEVVLGVQDISEFDGTRLRQLESVNLLPVDWEPEDLEAYIEDVFYFWRNHFSLQSALLDSLNVLEHEDQKLVIKNILKKSCDLVKSVDHESIEASILDFQAMSYGSTASAHGLPSFH
ncbi:hypothetical protein [Pseudoalteromonas marina]|uniref:Uncharacterized protein n=1 Tax=Pseudoalteromonas marina TaxID=267375 RepID=A0ABT9FBY1_9GAMM|nr:hypothetical protein [Pseudoalteromonas marina]MDP2564293.1 hypothetical protein [Pseudoalteromonas marina]